MRVEVVAVGTELLLGQIADTNSAWLGEQLALCGVDSHFHQAVGDNLDRIVLALRSALARSDGVIVCGGLGPTHDDITREAIAVVMNVALHEDGEVRSRLEEMFASRGRSMPESNLRQAQVPDGASVIPQKLGTAPGLICPVGHKVIYALPGVPFEMMEMFTRGVLPHLQERLAREGTTGVIASRVLRVWGMGEAALGEMLAPRIEALQGAGNPTIALLASGIEGLKVRITARAANQAQASALISAEEAHVRATLRTAVFGVDSETMEDAVANQLERRGLSLGLAESLTGGLGASRLVSVPGASKWFRGSIVSYASEVKRDLLGVPDGPVVSEQAARAMAQGAARVLGADIGLALSGVAGPDPQDGREPGTVFVAVAISSRPVRCVELSLPGDRERVRQYAVISAFDLLRRSLVELPP